MIHTDANRAVGRGRAAEMIPLQLFPSQRAPARWSPTCHCFCPCLPYEGLFGCIGIERNQRVMKGGLWRIESPKSLSNPGITEQALSCSEQGLPFQQEVPPPPQSQFPSGSSSRPCPLISTLRRDWSRGLAKRFIDVGPANLPAERDERSNLELGQ
jgi:hypothetical protein